MRGFAIVVSAIVGSCGVACAGSGSSQMNEAPHSVPPDDVILGSQIEGVKLAAVRGDSSASKRLWRFYIMVENDYAEWRFWLRLAAEQRDCRSMVELAKALNNVDKNERLAADWAQAAASHDCKAELLGEDRLNALINDKS